MVKRFITLIIHVYVFDLLGQSINLIMKCRFNDNTKIKMKIYFMKTVKIYKKVCK